MMSDEMHAELASRYPLADPRKTVAPRALIMLSQLLLLLVFLFGVSSSLWPPSGGWPASVQGLFGPSAGSYGYLSAHAIAAVLLVIVELLLVVFVYRLGRPPLFFVTLAAFLLIVVAAVAGSLTLSQAATGDSSYYILLMTTAFLAAWTLNLLVTVRLRIITRAARLRAHPPAVPPVA